MKQDTDSGEHTTGPLTADQLQGIHAYWRAANYLSVGQIYLMDNPLLRESLTRAHVKPRLLGHWGTTPGLNFIYAHLNRLIREYDLDMIYIAGPGHGGPGLVAHTYLEGSYSEFYPNISRDEKGMRRLFKQISFPGGIGSHATAETPGSIHEGGELGYAVSHAYGAAFDNPELIVACIVGDGEAETGPLATSWHSSKFLNPATDGAVLPILHLNGYKIANPTVLARISHDELEALFVGYGYTPYFVEGEDPMQVHQAMAATLDRIVADIRTIQHRARVEGDLTRPRWPMIVLRTPKGWTGPKEVDGKKTEGYWRSHQAPLAEVDTNKQHLKLLEQWLKSYEPETLFDEHGRLLPQLQALAPRGERRMGGNPHANGGLLLKALQLPDFRDYAVALKQTGQTLAESTRVMGTLLRGVMEILSEHTWQGWLEGYLLTGRHGLFSCYEAFIHIVDSMFNQHAKWLKSSKRIPWRRSVSSLNILLTSHVWRQDHNGFSHQDPGFIDVVCNKKADVVRVYLPPDGNTLLCV